MAATFTPKQKNWRFYQDNAAEPTVALAAENTALTLANNTDKIRLRVTIKETGGAAGTLTTLTAWYSTDNSSFTEITPSSAVWKYADGAATEDNVVAGLLLSDSDTAGRYMESVFSVSLGLSLSMEMDFCIQPNTPADSTLYYFRFTRLVSTEITLDTGETHPSLTTAFTSAGPSRAQPSIIPLAIMAR